MRGIVLRTSGDRRLYFDMMITMMPLRLRNAMSVITFTKMGRDWPMNLLKIKCALTAILKKTPAPSPDCAKHFI